MTKAELHATIAETFPQDRLEDVIALLDEYGTESHEPEITRVQFDIVKLSKGNLAELKNLVKQAKIDYRDILMWAESPLSPQEAALIINQLASWMEKDGKQELASELRRRSQRISDSC
jgi:predicted enzyme involved in methoxymalonyl-ACP biosynthesis